MKLSIATATLLTYSASAFVPNTNIQKHNVALPAVSIETPMAPLTKWGDRVNEVSVLDLQKSSKAAKKGDFPVLVTPDSLKLDSASATEQLNYFKENAEYYREQMVQNGAVHFKGFELMKSQEGFQSFYEALGMNPCLDPLHSVSARPTINGEKGSPVYEAVNKESRKNFFIGMHNEFVGTRAPRAAAFVCFKAAETGGEFLVADGRRIFEELSEGLIQKIAGKGIRYSVMELPFFGFLEGLPELIEKPVASFIQGAAEFAINSKVDFDVKLLWGQSDYDNTRMLQARAPSQPGVILHPETGEPHWFCNVHSHSSVLRKKRESLYGAERFEDGASQINKSDMFYGDDADLTTEELDEMDDIITNNIKYIKMSEGDVVLLDNYKTMHGRNVFDGTRKHGVAWFQGWKGMRSP